VGSQAATALAILALGPDQSAKNESGDKADQRVDKVSGTEGMQECHVTRLMAEVQLPTSVRWRADNYNNLMEQPTMFYAVALT
jgi:hypothetical protein